jgi:hypothetical protein
MTFDDWIRTTPNIDESLHTLTVDYDAAEMLWMSHQALVEALEKIAEGRAEFDMDNYKFACNVIEENRRAALTALALVKGESK